MYFSLRKRDSCQEVLGPQRKSLENFSYDRNVPFCCRPRPDRTHRREPTPTLLVKSM